MFELKRKKQVRRLHPETDSEFRSYIAERLRISERTVDRHLKLLRLPRAIQDAVSAGELGMIKAIKVDSLPRKGYEELKQRIDSGEGAAMVVAEFITKPPKRVDTLKEIFQRLVDFLDDNVPEFEAQQTELAEVIARSEQMKSVISRSGDLLIQLHELSKVVKKSRPKRSSKVKKASKRPR
jgi:hypothetical protein